MNTRFKVILCTAALMTTTVLMAQSQPSNQLQAKPVPAAQSPSAPAQDTLPISDTNNDYVNLKYLILQYQMQLSQKQLELEKQQTEISKKYDAPMWQLENKINEQYNLILKSNNWDPTKVTFDPQSLTFKVKHGEDPRLLSSSEQSPTPTVPSNKKKK